MNVPRTVMKTFSAWNKKRTLKLGKSNQGVPDVGGNIKELSVISEMLYAGDANGRGT